MEGQNYDNGSQQNNYQDYTSNMSYYAPPAEDVPNQINGLQIGSLVLGIIAICIVCCLGYPSIILGAVGLILAIAGNRKGKHGLGTAGMICSIIGIVLGIISSIYWTYVIYLSYSSEYYEMLQRMQSLY